ncbi:MAG: hypothetical protein SP1CHLAM54_11120 [Chlamydiia bacterium]|nr:hypothetical protein [Chlamydiia bacterium]MCH9616015.1 hypothetical protein [Chlamydiia bacterium]MCH9629038.1 hypothetical protein [Chlamydiia bacterium]
MKKYSIAIASLLCASTFALSPYPDAPRDYVAPHLPPDSFMWQIDLKNYQYKCSKPVPAWMDERVSKELAPFQERGISQRALDATFDKLQKSHLKSHFLRVRVIDERIYFMGNDEFGFRKFFRTIARCSDFPGIPDLPHLDMIFTSEDGILLSDHPYGYWITEDESLQAPIATHATHEDAPYGISVIDRYTMYSWSKLVSDIFSANASNPWESKEQIAFWRGAPSDYDHKLWELPEAEAFAAMQRTPRHATCVQHYFYPFLMNAGYSSMNDCPAVLTNKLKPFMKPACSPAEHLHYAFLPVLDGCSCTYPGYLWRLASNSTVFKVASKHSQWFYDALEPYVHYVPILDTVQDQLDRVMWAQGHPEICKQIAENATKFVQENLMPEDIYLYHLNLFQRYSDLQTFTREELIQMTENDPRWTRFR